MSANESKTFECGRSGPPHLRFIHYNDVYHVEAGSAEPVGGAARFQTLCNYYRDDKTFEGQPELLTLFSGDVFNPSLESSVTKGSHMVPVLNNIGTDIACVGNHDLDFGVPQFQYLAKQCDFPWLIANVLDPALGDDVALAGAYRTYVLTVGGIKVGFIGLVEREWLDTINSLPPNLIYRSASATAKELVPALREQGAEIVVALTHAREPNDRKLASNIPEGLIDLVLGGHDHMYNHLIINGTHVLRSGTDFKNLSYIQAWRSGSKPGRWDFDITRRDVTSQIAEDPETNVMVEEITSGLKRKLEKPVGYVAAPLDARFSTVRLSESNMGNFVCDLMRLHYDADCTIMAAGTIRGDQIYPPGLFRLKDIMNCFPFEDPVVVLKLKGQAVWDALENGVSLYPALEGRFPQVSGIEFEFDPNAPAGSRVRWAKIGSRPLDRHRDYRLCTRGYMTRGKDGYTSLLSQEEGGEAEELVSEENGVLISTILRQYFMSLKVIGRWKRFNLQMKQHWTRVQDDLHLVHPAKEANGRKPSVAIEVSDAEPVPAAGESRWDRVVNGTDSPLPKQSALRRKSTFVRGQAIDSDSSDEEDNAGMGAPGLKLRVPGGAARSPASTASASPTGTPSLSAPGTSTRLADRRRSTAWGYEPAIGLLPEDVAREERELALMRKFSRRWWKLAGLKGVPHPVLEVADGGDEEGGGVGEEFIPGWTKGVKPRVEGRVRMIPVQG